MELSKDSALSIKEGVDKAPKTINTKNRRRKKTPLSIDDYISGILKGNRVILGQAITLIESKLTRHQIMAHQIIEACLPH
ncbi:MAG: methylmalonyl Co-A mutase-associated GTPase MeaB, partial [Bacteroidota bacterium]